MSDEVVHVASAIVLSEQRLAEARRWACEARASDLFALLGERTDRCVCGQHEGVVPIAPLLTDP